MAAREAARSAAYLDELRAMLERFEGCALRTTATQLVFADGNPQARVMFVGEAPGRDEDIEGLPFVGRSGQAARPHDGGDRARPHERPTSPTSCRGGRPATARRRRRRSAICLPFTLRQIELVDPDILVCLGNPSTQTLLDSQGRHHSRRADAGCRSTPARARSARLPTLHPAYLLRQPLQQAACLARFPGDQEGAGDIAVDPQRATRGAA